MAVYTEVSDAELTAFMGAFDLGQVLSFKGIAEGVENSNFLLHTSKGSFFLTNLGVAWPKIVNGKPTGESAIQHVGDMELVDVIGSVGTTEKNPLALVMRTLHGKMCLGFATGRNVISDQDARDFPKLVIDKALRFL